MKNMKKLVALLLALALVFSLCACGSTSSDSDSTADDSASTAADDSSTGNGNEVIGGNDAEVVSGTSDETLTIALSEEPSGLYNQYVYWKPSAVVAMCLYDTLIEWNEETQEAEPKLASSWEWVDDTHIRFTLRDDIVFADGSPLTADDVLFTYQIGAEHDASAYTRVFDIDNFVVEDEHNIVMALNTTYPTLLEILGGDVYTIIGKNAVEALGGEDAAARNPQIGTGKYNFVEWVDGQYILLERNEDYWDQDNLPYYKNIKFVFISDNASRAMAVQSGDVDIADDLSATQIDGLLSDSSLNVVVDSTTTNRTIYMNDSSEPFNDVRVREAIYKLINPQAILAIANDGYGTVSETNFSTLCSMYDAPEDTTREVDIEGAKALLEEAGYTDSNPLSFTLLMPNEGSNQTFAELVKEQLAQGGINCEISLLDIGTFLPQLWGGDYEMVITADDQWDYVKLLYKLDGRIDSETAGGGAQYMSDELNALIDQAESEYDYDARKEVYAQIQQYVRENFVTVGVCNDLHVVVTTADLSNVTFTLAGYPNFSEVRPVA
jgi:peptide/nickel transport system substrate-binding protein